MKYLMRLEGDVVLKEFAIYLAGGMGKFGKDNFDKGNTWRKYCKHILEHFDGSKYSINVINPNDYFKKHSSEIPSAKANGKNGEM